MNSSVVENTLQVEMGEWKAHLTSSEGCALPWVMYSKVRIYGCGLRWIFFEMSFCLYLYYIYCFSVFDGSRKILNARRKLNLLLSDKVILIQKLLSKKGWSFTDMLTSLSSKIIIINNFVFKINNFVFNHTWWTGKNWFFFCNYLKELREIQSCSNQKVWE